MEQKETANKEPKRRSIQDYLSLGYLYLLILGVITDAVKYGFLGVNIINYSSVFDVLLTPIVYLTKDITLLISFIVLSLIICLFFYYLQRYYKKNKDEDWYKKKMETAKANNTLQVKPIDATIIVIAIAIFGGFTGYGLGGGIFLSKDLKAGELGVNRIITFVDGETENVRLIGHNSQYLFYAVEKDTVITITPIQGIYP